jgi:hypothetical protein
MAEDYYSIENRIQRALDATKRVKNPNLSEIARKFDVPYQRLRRRVKKGASRSTRPSTGRRLTESQESALYRYINIFNNLNISTKPSIVRNAANSILYKANPKETDPPPKTSNKWLKRFIERHPEYRVRRRQALDINRKKAHKPDIILDWFQHLKAKINEFRIAEEDI